MTPTSPDNQPGFELPKPSAQEGVPPMPSETAPQKAEQQSRQAELPGTSLPLVAATPPVNNVPAGTIPSPAPTTDASTASSVQHSAPAMADDVDLIEKEWVDKAKAIVNRTREDPHMQNKQLNEFKADYMKKRYGKEIRLTDE